jgi:hypothetical protein
MSGPEKSKHVNLSPDVGDIYEWCPFKSYYGVNFSLLPLSGFSVAKGYFLYLGNNWWWSLELGLKGFIPTDEVNRKMRKVPDPSLL